MSTTAKALFDSGNYSAAESAFLANATAATDATEIALQLSNAAQCALKLEQYSRAVNHARRAIKNDAHNTKAHFRLATALSSVALSQNIIDVAHHCCEIAIANTCVVALSGNKTLRLPGLDIISSQSHPVCQRAGHLLRSVINSGAALIKSTEKMIACRNEVVVLDSNDDVTFFPGWCAKHIVGLDRSTKIAAGPFSPHAFFVEDDTVVVWRIRFTGASRAMVCAVGNVSLIKCEISHHNENGVLCAGPETTVLLAFCNITRCTLGLEVREGASLNLFRCSISHITRQGISCYAGAKDVLLEETTIEDVGIEGVQCLGLRAPRTIVLDSSLRGATNRVGSDPFAAAVADQLAEEARQNASSAPLQVNMLNCTLRRCGTNSSPSMIRSGVTVDQGAKLVMKGCLLRHCDMAGVFIKGESNANILHCRMEHGTLGDSGVRVDINYMGIVSVKDCAFVGKLNKAIVDSLNHGGMTARTQIRAIAGAVSLPVIKTGNKISSDGRKVPSIETLRARSKSLIDHLTLEDDTSTHESDQSSSHSSSQAQGWSLQQPKLRPKFGAMSYRQLGVQHAWVDYPIGNTYGRNMLERVNVANFPEHRIRVLLAACGDIRNVVETIASREPTQTRITFILNDLSTAILARNIVLLELAARLWPLGKGSSSNASATWLYAWGSIALKESDRAEIDAVIVDLAARKLPSWLHGVSKETLEALVRCWSSWLTCSRSLTDVRKERRGLKELLKKQQQGNPIGSVAAAAAGLPAKLNNIPELNDAELLKGRGSSVNPTLLSVEGHEYNMYESSIFRALDMRKSIRGTRSRLIKGACEVMETKGSHVAAALQKKEVQIVVIPGDLTMVLGTDVNADIADMSNVMDYVSMPACIFAAARCMRRLGGIVTMQSMITSHDIVGGTALMNEPERCTIQDACAGEVAAALGLRTVKKDNMVLVPSPDHGRARCKIWCFEIMRRESVNTEQLLNTIVPWIRWPTFSRVVQGVNGWIAAWPSSVLCLQILAAASAGTKWITLVDQVCNASRMAEHFKLQLKAHAALIDDVDERDQVVVGSFTIGDNLDESMMNGYGRNFILRLTSNNDHDHVHYYDVFDQTPDRGVCEILLCKSDIETLRKCRVDIQSQCTSRKSLECVWDSASMNYFPTMKVRDLTKHEKCTLRSRLLL